MTLLVNLLRRMPRIIVLLLLVIAFIIGSHAGLDFLVASLGNSCVTIDATTQLCVMPRA